MSVNSVGSGGNTPYTKAYGANNTGKGGKNTKIDQTTVAALASDSVELGSSSEAKTYKPDQAQLNKLWAQVNASTQPLRDMVEKLLAQTRDSVARGANIAKAAEGGETIDLASIFSLKGKGDRGDKFELEIDAETQAWAKEQISDEGFWGAPQTAQRLIDFASALSGGDPSKADALMSAVEKGFNQVAKVFGGWDKLPDVTKKTFELVKEGFAKWKETGSPPTAEEELGTETV